MMMQRFIWHYTWQKPIDDYYLLENDVIRISKNSQHINITCADKEIKDLFYTINKRQHRFLK